MRSRVLRLGALVALALCLLFTGIAYAGSPCLWVFITCNYCYYYYGDVITPDRYAQHYDVDCDHVVDEADGDTYYWNCQNRQQECPGLP